MDRRGLAGLASGVFLISALLLASGPASFGIVWDEPRGFFSGVFRVLDWLKNPSDLETYWPLPDAYSQKTVVFYNHPPLARYCGAAAWSLFHSWLGDIPAMRMAPVLLFSLSLAVIFFWTSKEYGAPAGFFSAAALASMPRVLGHAFVLTADVALLASWILAGFVYFEFSKKPWGAAAVGLSWGLLILSKFTGLLWIFPVFLHDRLLRRYPARFWLKAAAVAALTAWALNPSWWGDPWSGFFKHHLLLSLTRDSYLPISVFYLGKIYQTSPPWHYVPVLLLTTVPVLTLGLGFFGAFAALKEGRKDSLGVFALLQLALMVLLFSSPMAPKYDGVRLFLVVFPWLAVLSGIGFSFLTDNIRSAKAAWAAALLAAVLLLGRAAQTHPFEFSYYNALAGGAKGAVRWGLESTYYWEAVTPSFCRRLNELLPPGSQVQVYPAAPDHFAFLQFAGFLRKDIRFVAHPAEYFLLLSRQGQFTPAIWNLYLNKPPLEAVRFEGVPLVQLYKMDDKGDPSGTLR